MIPRLLRALVRRFVGEADVVFAFLQRAGGGVFSQAAVTMLDPEHLSPLFEKRKGGRGDHGVGGRCGSAGKQDRDAFDVQRMMVRHGGSRQEEGSCQSSVFSLSVDRKKGVTS